MWDLRLKERLSVGMLVLTGIVLLLAAVSHVRVYAYLSEIRIGLFGATGIDDARAQSLDDAVNLWNLAAVACTLLTSIPFLAWLAAAVGNVHARGVRNLRFSEAWAVGWWFVPFLNLVRPLQVVQELYGASFGVRSGRDEILFPTTSLVSWWWLAWIGSGVLACCGTGLAATSQGNLDGLRFATLTAVGADLVRVLAAVLAIRVVTTISKMQREWPQPAATPVPS